MPEDLDDCSEAVPHCHQFVGPGPSMHVVSSPTPVNDTQTLDAGIPNRDDPEDHSGMQYVGISFVIVLVIVSIALWVGFTKTSRTKIRGWYHRARGRGKPQQDLHLETAQPMEVESPDPLLLPNGAVLPTLPRLPRTPRLPTSPGTSISSRPNPERNQSMESAKMSRQNSKDVVEASPRGIGTPTFEEAVMQALPPYSPR